MAAQLDGVSMPDTLDKDGVHFVLNGMALRTYSFLSIRIYVAGLYLLAPSHDPDQIIGSDSPRMLQFEFLRDVDAWAARRSWREGLARSCQPPCHLPPQSVERFLAGVPAVRSGDTSTLLFTKDSLIITMDNKVLGRIDDPLFSRTILSTFIGPHPTAESMKQGLLDTPK
jgi:hypothetical protein